MLRHSRRFPSRNRPKHLFLSFLVLLIFFLGITYGFANLMQYGIKKCNFLNFKKVTFQGINYINENKLEFKFSKFAGRNIYDIHDTEIEAVSEYFPGIKSIKVFRFPPHTIKVKIVERKPIAYIKNEFGTIYLIDHDGILLAKAKNFQEYLLPRFEGININNLTMGEQVVDISFNSLVKGYDAICKVDPKLMNKIVSLRKEKEGVTLQGRNRDQRFILGEEDYDSKIGNLIFAFNYLTSSNYAEIDLRFSDMKNDLVIMRNN